MKKYRVCILGCRARGTSAARGYHVHPRTEVVGLCDLQPELLATLGDELGVKARFSDLDEMISQTSPDIVAIPTGTEFHYDLGMRVLEHGVNIDIEKPMCVDLVQADSLLAKSVEKNVKIAVHHQGRVGAPMRSVWKAYQAGKIGELRYMQGSGKGYYGGYGILNIGTHMINNMLRFAGHCKNVSATALTRGRMIEPEDVVPSPSGMGTMVGEHITANLTFEGNVTATLLQHRFPVMDSSGYTLMLYGTEGRLLWKNEAWYLDHPHYLPDAEHSNWELMEPEYLDGFDPNGTAGEMDFAYADDYVNALDEGREHECSGPEALHVIEVMMGIFESAAYRKHIALPQQDRTHPLIRWRAENGLGAPTDMPRGYPDWLKVEDEKAG